jgi:hypothetical protein
VLHLNRTGNTGTVVSLRQDGVQVGTISVTTGATQYNTGSDYRLKRDWAPIKGALDLVMKLRPYRGYMKSEEDPLHYFLAHEAAEVVPYAVTGEKDEVDEGGEPVMQGMDNSRLVPLLTGAIHDLRAQLDDLRQQVEALAH